MTCVTSTFGLTRTTPTLNHSLTPSCFDARQRDCRALRRSLSRTCSETAEGSFWIFPGRFLYGDCRPGTFRALGRTDVATRNAAPETREDEHWDGLELNFSELPAASPREGGGGLSADAEVVNEEMLEVGLVLGPHGLQGDVRVKVFTDFPEQRFGKPGWKWLRPPGVRATRESGALQRLWCTHGRLGPGRGAPWLLQFRGIESVDDAARLQGSVLLVPASERPALGEGEVYSADLIGLHVLLQSSGEVVGTVEDVFTAGGAGELLRVKLLRPMEKGQEGRQRGSCPEEEASRGGETQTDHAGEAAWAWVPFVKAIVPGVDFAAGCIRITPPQGLLEVSSPPRSRVAPRRNKKGNRRRDPQKKEAQHPADG